MLLGISDIDWKVNDEAAATPQVTGVDRRDIGQDCDNDIVAETLKHPDAMGGISMGQNKHFYSHGAFNLVQLVLYLLKQTGPAHVFISSYSIAEDSLATLKRYQEQGRILSVSFLIDNRVRTITSRESRNQLIKRFG